MSMIPNYQHYKRFQDCSRSDESIAIASKFHRRRFSLCPGLPRSLPTRRIPRRACNISSTCHHCTQGREKFCKKTDGRSVLPGAEGGTYFWIDYWLLVIGYWILDIQLTGRAGDVKSSLTP